jgi:hypothetical protein
MSACSLYTIDHFSICLRSHLTRPVSNVHTNRAAEFDPSRRLGAARVVASDRFWALAGFHG